MNIFVQATSYDKTSTTKSFEIFEQLSCKKTWLHPFILANTGSSLADLRFAVEILIYPTTVSSLVWRYIFFNAILLTPPRLRHANNLLDILYLSL